jgi:gas vesicle protein
VEPIPILILYTSKMAAPALDGVFVWLEKARPKLETFRDSLRKHPSKQDLFNRLVQILAVNADTPKSPALAATVAAVREEMTKLIKDLKDQSQRNKNSVENGSSNGDLKSSPESKSSPMEKSPAKEQPPMKLQKTASSESAAVNKEPVKPSPAPVIPPSVSLDSIRTKASELQRIMTYCLKSLTDEIHVKQMLAKIKGTSDNANLTDFRQNLIVLLCV